MHGTLGLGAMQTQEKPGEGHAPVLKASFQKGRGWFIAVVDSQRMNWLRRWRFTGKAHEWLTGFGPEHDILELGFETFVPAERRYRVVRGRKTEITTPLFGGYVFVRFDREADYWENILNLEICYDILQINEIPVRVPDDLIELMRRSQDVGAFDYINGKAALAAGDVVKVEGKGSAYEDLLGKVLSASPRKRAKILMDRLGVLEIDTCFLRKM